MAKWAEIKCERCAEQDALWEGMERALEESDAREARLKAKLAKVIAAYRIEAMRRDDYRHTAFNQHIVELIGQGDE